MTHYAKFPGLGSDAVFILDGRNTMQTMIFDTKKQIKRLSKVRTINSFKIIKATNFRDMGEIVYEENLK